MELRQVLDQLVEVIQRIQILTFFLITMGSVMGQDSSWTFTFYTDKGAFDETSGFEIFYEDSDGQLKPASINRDALITFAISLPPSCLVDGVAELQVSCENGQFDVSVDFNRIGECANFQLRHTSKPKKLNLTLDEGLMDKTLLVVQYHCEGDMIIGDISQTTENEK